MIDSNEIIDLYKMIRDGNCINDKKLIDKEFILKLMNAPKNCFESDLEALNFLLDKRAVLICANEMMIGGVYKITGTKQSVGIKHVTK